MILRNYDAPDALLSASETAVGLTLDAPVPAAIKTRLEAMRQPRGRPRSQPLTAKTPAHYEEALKAFVAQVDSTYPFFDLKGIRADWDRCKADLLARVKTCRTPDTFSTLLWEAKCCLRDAHLGFTDLKGKIAFPEYYYPGVSFLPAAKGQVVIMGAPSDYQPMLSPGVVVTHIDGQPARAFLEAEAARAWREGGPFSSPQRARLFAFRMPLKGKQGETHQLTIAAQKGVQVVAVASKWPVRGWPHMYAMPAGLQRYGRSCWYALLGSGYGYIYLRYIDRSFVPGIDAAMKAFGQAKGVIFDLRGNGGGGYGTDFHMRFDKKAGPQPGAPFYDREIVVLIDAGTTSAGETVARDLARLAGAHVMGSRTSGASSAKRAWTLPYGLGTVIFSTRSRGGIGGTPIEYNGIAPQEEVEIVPEELQAGLNSGILRAEEYLDRKLRPANEGPKRRAGQEQE